jgi:hypothetical protein
METQTTSTTTKEDTMTTLTTVIPDGDYSIEQLVSLRSRRIAWSGEPDREVEVQIEALCKDALDQIGQDGEATGVEITAGQITALLTD